VSEDAAPYRLSRSPREAISTETGRRGDFERDVRKKYGGNTVDRGPIRATGERKSDA